MPGMTDTQLMAGVRTGELKNLARLFEHHHVALFRYFVRLSRNRDVSEDLVQEVFLRILKYRQTFRDGGEFSVWMYHIARNVHLDNARKWNMESHVDDQEQEPASDHSSPLGALEQAQEHRFLEEALSRLPVEKRELIILSRFQQLRYDAIADILDCSVAAVKVRMHRAMNDLRTLYFQLSGEIPS